MAFLSEQDILFYETVNIMAGSFHRSMEKEEHLRGGQLTHMCTRTHTNTYTHTYTYKSTQVCTFNQEALLTPGASQGTSFPNQIKTLSK